MPGNTFGKTFRLTSWGESHGKAMGGVIDGCPSNIPLNEEDLQLDLDRRRPGQSEITTQRQESDKVEILSGVFEGKTLGTPISFLVWNKDQSSKDYSNLKDVYRPGHADLVWEQKYGIRDYRGGGRASGRETLCRVAAGAVAKKILVQENISIIGYTCSISDIEISNVDESEIEKNLVRAPDKEAAQKMVEVIEKARAEGDSLGGVVEIVAKGVPTGLGEPVFDKLDAELVKALMSIGTVKGVEVGNGFAATKLKGSENNDPVVSEDGKTSSNNTGGITGGITNGNDIVLRVAVKPTSSISKKQATINKAGEKVDLEISGRHDPCICPRLVPVAEAMVALVLVDYLLMQKVQR